jgi:hypothetical protein
MAKKTKKKTKRGPGRPPAPYRRRQLHLELPADLVDRFDAVAAELGVPKVKLGELLIRKGLDRLESVAQKLEDLL